MKRYLLTPLAEEDLNRIDEYLSERFGNAVAEQATERLIHTFELLATQPRIGQTRPQWTSEEVLFSGRRDPGRGYLPRRGTARGGPHLERKTGPQDD